MQKDSWGCRQRQKLRLTVQDLQEKFLDRRREDIKEQQKHELQHKPVKKQLFNIQLRPRRPQRSKQVEDWRQVKHEQNSKFDQEPAEKRQQGKQLRAEMLPRELKL